MKTKLPLKEAIRFSIIKWERIYSNNGVDEGGEWTYNYDGRDEGLLKDHPEFANMLYECGLCELYYNKDSNCHGCPLVICGKACYNKNHPWYNWRYNQTKENSKIILNLVKSIKI